MTKGLLRSPQPEGKEELSQSREAKEGIRDVQEGDAAGLGD